MSETDKQKRKPKLPAHLQAQRDYVTCGPDLNYHTSIPNSANVYMPLGIDNAWDFNDFQENLKVEVQSFDDDENEMVFDLVGVDTSIANALRRILIAEVPTMAIEHVFVVDNTSLMPDEMLAHRLGLIPLSVDPRLFSLKNEEQAANEKNTIVMKLDVTCKWVDQNTYEPKQVTSGMLEWLEGGSELPEETSVRFASTNSQSALLPQGIAPVDDNILLMKLRPGQCIQVEAHATKGIGRDHAKWSPVATAWYKLKPEVILLKDVHGTLADELAAECPGLIEVEGKGLNRKAKVDEAREHEQLLEKVRRLSGEDKWSPYVQLRKKKDHFIFTVQSTGALPPAVLFEEALTILAEKCDKLLKRL